MNQEPQIIFEDDAILVCNKPAGLIVNNADTSRHVMTLQDWISQRITIHHEDKESDFVKRSGIVHRLDKETSGLLLIAKTIQSFENLQMQFKEKRVEKVYIGLCHGRVVPMEGEINVPVGRLPWDRKKFGVIPEGRESITHYKVLSYKKLIQGKKEEYLSLVEMYPKTGRTHQIRVHFRYHGYPLFGDELYAGRQNSRDDRKVLPRHFLHAKKITFVHPVSNERLSFEAELPTELSSLLESLQTVD